MLEAVYQSKQAGLGRLTARMVDLRSQRHALDHPDYAAPDSAAARAGANLRWDTWVEQRKTLINREPSEAARQRELIRSDVAQALARLEPCRVAWGSGRATFATNRRENRPEADVPQRRTAGHLQGPVDHAVPVLSIHDIAGTLKAVLFGYACHATTLSGYQWCGDYPGYAQLELEKKHPGCVALFFAGCGADQNPLPRRSVALAEHYGERLATAVNTVLLTTQMQELKHHASE